MWVDKKDALKVVHSVAKMAGQLVPLLATSDMNRRKEM